MPRFGTWLSLLLALLALGLGGEAAATTLFAGPLRVAQGDSIVCPILNVGKKDLTEVIIEAHTNDLETEGPLTLAAGGTAQASNSVSEGSNRISWCRFTFKGGKKAARASACVSISGSFSCVAAVPAR
jgi:hypothetical protein